MPLAARLVSVSRTIDIAAFIYRKAARPYRRIRNAVSVRSFSDCLALKAWRLLLDIPGRFSSAVFPPRRSDLISCVSPLGSAPRDAPYFLRTNTISGAIGTPGREEGGGILVRRAAVPADECESHYRCSLALLTDGYQRKTPLISLQSEGRDSHSVRTFVRLISL